MKYWYVPLLFLTFSCAKEEKQVEVLPINEPHLLIEYLKNPDPKKREIAAFYIGQTKDSNFIQVLTNSFENTDTARVFAKSNAAILEALGKLGNSEILDFITGISSYKENDTFLHTGRISALYEFGLRDLISEAGTKLAIDYISNNQLPEKSRFYAAHYLARVKNIKLDSFAQVINAAMIQENNPWIKMALITAGGRTEDTLFISSLQEILVQEKDPRIIVNSLRALGNIEDKRIVEILKAQLKHPHWTIPWTAANLLIDKGSSLDAINYYELAKNMEDVPTKILLFKATLRHLPTYSTLTREATINQLFKLSNHENPHFRANALLGLSEDRNTIDLFKEKGLRDSSALVRKTTMQILREANLLSEEFLNSKDPSILFEAALGFSPENVEAKKLAKAAFSEMKMPQNLEVAMAISSLTGDSIPLLEEYYSVKKTTKNVSFATIVNSKGNIKIKLYPEIAPLSVSAFIQLIEQGFYNGLTFHRVVPNFVIQGGCPVGDGLGGPDFLLKTETGLLYYDIPGRVGLASAGSGTEGSQFFITHSPAPHLNGKYTIFAQVTAGMEVVDAIREGDKIQKIILE